MIVAVWWYVRRKENNVNMGLPIHKAIYKGLPIDDAMLDQHLETAKMRNKHGKTAIELVCSVLQSGGSGSVSEEVVYRLVVDSLHFNPAMQDANVIEDVCEHNFAWGEVVQQSDDVMFHVVERVLVEFESHLEALTTHVDQSGRRYVDVACPRSREAMNRCLYLGRRFELKAGPPEHKSATSVVQFAIDQDSASAARVALKFMRNRVQFEAELSSREGAGFSSDFVLLVQESFDGDSREDRDVQFRASAKKKGFSEYPYCLVMDVADSNLQRVIFQQNIAGSDWDMIRLILKTLCASVAHVHSKLIVHGDLKPMNVVLLGNSVRLIDFDACARFAVPGNGDGDETEGDYVGGSTVNGVVEYAGSKYSSAYSPPELFFQTSSGKIVVKSFEKDVATGLPMKVRKVSRGDRHSAMQQ